MIKVTDQQYWMDPILKNNLDSIIFNVPNDWDGVIQISGDGMVRVGKSVLAQQVGYYCAYNLETPFTLNNIVFSGRELIDKAKTYPKNSVFVYDEARGELDTKKVMEDMTKILMDFFAECGMYNHIIILVLPDFFDLPKGLAINRSECLINVYRKKEIRTYKDGTSIVSFERGFFEFFGRDKKKKLYMIGKKNFNDYRAVKYDFYGEFREFFTVNKEEYIEKKKTYLARERTKSEKTRETDIVLKVLCTHISLRQASEELEKEGYKISYARIQQRISKIVREEIQDGNITDS